MNRDLPPQPARGGASQHCVSTARKDRDDRNPRRFQVYAEPRRWTLSFSSFAQLSHGVSQLLVGNNVKQANQTSSQVSSPRLEKKKKNLRQRKIGLGAGWGGRQPRLLAGSTVGTCQMEQHDQAVIHQDGLKEPFELRTRAAVIPGAGSGRLPVTGWRGGSGGAGRGGAEGGVTGRSDGCGGRMKVRTIS